MSKANKELAQRWIDAVNAGDVEAFRSTMAEAVVHEVPGTCLMSGKRSREEVCEAIALVNSLTKDGLEIEVLSMTAEDDRVSVEAVGAAEMVSGVPYNNGYHLLFRMRDGQIVGVREFVDTKLVEDVFAPLLAGAT